MADYKLLTHKPKINGTEVSGSKELKDYSISPIMYDSVTRYLYTILPDGTRANIKSVPLIPYEYTQVECIQSGSGQYFNTGINVADDIRFEIKFQSFDKYSWQNFGAIFGARKSSKVNEVQLTTYRDDGSTWSGSFRIGTLSNNARLASSGSINTVVFDQENNYYVNGTLYNTFEVSSFTHDQPIAMFALNNNGTITQNGNVRIYYCKFYKAGVLVRDYIPCVRNSDSTPGMYDRVSKTFNGSATATPFIVPST